jgi:hypothetical protein
MTGYPDVMSNRQARRAAKHNPSHLRNARTGQPLTVEELARVAGDTVAAHGRAPEPARSTLTEPAPSPRRRPRPAVDPMTTALRAVEVTRLEIEVVQRRQRREVDEARAAGASWAKIGAALGVTKQSAQGRFG